MLSYSDEFVENPPKNRVVVEGVESERLNNVLPRKFVEMGECKEDSWLRSFRCSLASLKRVKS